MPISLPSPNFFSAVHCFETNFFAPATPILLDSTLNKIQTYCDLFQRVELKFQQ